MASKGCMNGACGATSSIRWRRGWDLRSGGSANLCDRCGSVYEQFIFCETFHFKESGWRDCSLCGKRLHCGCVASKCLLELLDNGGVGCTSCLKSTGLSSIPSAENRDVLTLPATDDVGDLRSTAMDCRMDGANIDMRKLMQLGSVLTNEQNSLLQSLRDGSNGSIGQIKREQPLSLGEVGGTSFSYFNQPSVSSQHAKQYNNKESVGNETYDSLAQTCLSMSLGVPSGNANFAMNHTSAVTEVSEQSKVLASFQQGQRSRHLMPKLPKVGPGTGPEPAKDMLPQIRVARPPVEGRGRSQLLPRYWPRITDQELQQISGDSNSTIVPLFEKVLSASDAGRIGRLVLPKACAEAYFPPISQPEGLPLRIQDVKGKEWVFQFRFWPNNNSRMYVLEGVTPCIQSMQLQAGDTVTFSRLDPERKLVMGFRKASNCATLQDTQVSSSANGSLANENFFSGAIEKLPVISGYSALLQPLKRSTDPHLSAMSNHMHSGDGNSSWRKNDKHGGRGNEGLSLQPLLIPEKKRSRNIGSKSKRLHIDSEDALELRLTWEEAQELFRPPPNVKPSTVMIEDYEFEEYEEPPVFGKKTIFTVGSTGGQDQWVQCDSCSKWRRVPVDVLLPPKWTCSDNIWDSKRCTCSVPDELSPGEIENLLRLNMDFRKRRVTASYKQIQEHEPSGLDALATAAVLGDAVGDLGTSSVATTTKHPRHRVGCTCIVCIQPPSGKGPKHKPTCICNVCMTVKRRFKTLMMRKKKRQSEKEAEIAQSKQHMWGPKDEVEVESASRCESSAPEPSDKEAKQVNMSEPSSQLKALSEKALDTSKSQIDLNCDPDRDEEMQMASARVSMMSLLQVANLPLQKYLRQNGLTSLAAEQQASSSSHALPQATVESEGRQPDDGSFPSVAPEPEKEQEDHEDQEMQQEGGGSGGLCGPVQCQNDPI